MAGIKGQNVGNHNAIGNSGGKSLNDRKLAARVRTLALGKIEDILNQPIVKMKADDYELYKAILVKLAGTVLPKINEVTGEDGEALVIKIQDYDRGKNNAPAEAERV
ncbi:MAG: hypothetical protein KKH98_00910 [Spirochaetes bacterium]|nr:hypothetical protein [Spirochaetota bacterium]